MRAFRRLLQSLAVGALQWDRPEQDHHHQVEPPDFVGLAKAVDASHLSLLVRVRHDAVRRGAAGPHALNETVATLMLDVLAQLRQQTRGPLLTNIDRLALRHRQQQNITQHNHILEHS